MAKEILRFKGLSLNRDEQSAQHGELSVCAGLELHDGALRPSVLDGTTVAEKLVVEKHYDFTEEVSKWTATLLYVHETASYRHYIGTIETLETELWWFNEDGTQGGDESIHNFREEIISVNSIGKTLLVMTKTGVHYILWKHGEYKYLGTQPPFVDISFRPSENHEGKYDHSTITDIDYFNYNTIKDVAARQLDINITEILYPINGSFVSAPLNVYEDRKSTITEAVKALVNETNSAIAQDGHFYAPFLIRYCYRLYDGSMSMHSAPVFVNVSQPYSYRVWADNFWVQHTSDGGRTWFVNRQGPTLLFYYPNNVSILYNVINHPANAENLRRLKEEWGDIVKSIDVFVSPMMARENLDELIERFCVDRGAVFGVRDDNTIRKFKDDDRHDTDSLMYADIKMYEEDEYLQRLKDFSEYRKLMSFDLDKDTIATSSDYQELKYDKKVVPTITSQELMKDDYHTHYGMSPKEDNSGVYIYNHRLHLYGMNEKLFEGFHLRTMINTYDKDSHDSPGTPYNYNVAKKYIKKIVVELDTDEGSKFVESDAFGEAYPVRSICHSLLFYPDSRAIRMTLYFCDESGVPNGKKLVLRMEECNFLNGAMASELFFKDSFEETDMEAGETSPDVDDEICLDNMVITSEVDNPFYFPIEGRNTVGIGAIVGLAAVTRALSQGQVGDHDLIAFCTDGIWVLKVASTGTYSAMHNISREVCTNAKSICQLDQSVVFATQRSLSRFVESNVVSMSDMLDGPIRNWTELFGSFFDDKELIKRQLLYGTPAVEVFNHGSVFYDYAGSRVVVLPADTSQPSVALVFSVRDQTWSTMPIPAIMAVVPGYPSPFVQLAGEGENAGKIIMLDKTYDYDDAEAEASPGLILTRTLTFSDTMDVIRGFQHHADSEEAPVLFLFGSNDQRHWNIIGQTPRWYYNYLPGQSYRFFRIAVYTQMKPSEEYQDLMLEIVNKYRKL